jgi:hypothetical protein
MYNFLICNTFKSHLIYQSLKTNKCTIIYCVYSKIHNKTLKKLLHVSVYRSSPGSTRSSLLKHSSWDHVTTQAPPLRQSRDTFGGGVGLYCIIILQCKIQKTQFLFWHSEDRAASWYIPVIKPTRCTNFSNLFFGIELYMFRTVSLSIIRV